MTDFGPPWEAGPPPPGSEPYPALPAPTSAPRHAPAQRPRWLLAGVLFALTFLTTTTMGAVWVLYTSTQETTDLPLLLLPQTVARVWSDPALLRLGLSFSIPALFILLCHELGHYLACRRYRLPATLPYFLPLPLGVGTLGAFIKIKVAIRTKRELFDVGVAGPVAGFVALIPFLVAGIAWSRPIPLSQVADPTGAGVTLLVPGRSLAVLGLERLFHGPVGSGQVLQLHPFALAAWFGLLATALNLIPLAQLDGGHILYAALGRVQRRLALGIWMLLLGAALFVWPGWMLWCVVTLVLGLHHPPVDDEARPLSPGRRRLAWIAGAIFLLSFMPVPIDQVDLAPGSSGPTIEVSQPPPAPLPAQVSRTKVTGPSLTSSTSMCARKRPVATL